MHVFKLCVSQGLSLSFFLESLNNGKQALNLFLTVMIKFVYQWAPLMYNAPQSSDSIISINLWQFRSPNILIFGLSFITWPLCGFKDIVAIYWTMVLIQPHNTHNNHSIGRLWRWPNGVTVCILLERYLLSCRIFVIVVLYVASCFVANRVIMGLHCCKYDIFEAKTDSIWWKLIVTIVQWKDNPVP